QQTRRIAQQNNQGVEGDVTGCEGVVISPLRQQAEIEDSATGERYRCHLRANLPPLTVGDRVVWQPGSPTGVVVALKPRRNCIQRPDSFGNLKLVAANVDCALIVLAPEPVAHANLIDRYLVALHALDIRPVLVLNKSDLLVPDHPMLALAASYEALGYTCLKVSAQAANSLEPLQRVLAEGTSILVGQSGVGKSSLLQALLPDEQIKIGELSEGVAKGRHTTTHARLYHFAGGGACIDSPGIREFGLGHLSPEQVAQGFVEFEGFLGQCKFRNCLHQQDPGCALLHAREEGVISSERFASYQQILASQSLTTPKTSTP
ncbi:MAG TPA: small ribosomal subunit biogenesis GTPase RsgA, partial [Cellvibrionaceae bacterium]|nr:small ribosomal subunit biogenesis GTPase RsgA [Cellvibrionaceae bacterium]